MSSHGLAAASLPRKAAGKYGGRDALTRRSWGNWLLLAVTFIATTTGLGLAIAALLPDRMANPWPWVRTDVTLVCACLLLVVTLVLHLSHEQRHLNRLNVEIVRFENEVREASRRRLYGLLNVSRMMGVHNKPEVVFDHITKACVEAFSCDRASLMIHNERARTLVVRAAAGRGDVSRILDNEQSIGDGVAGWAAQNKKALLIGRERELRENPALKLTSASLVAAMVVPIILRDELVGVINVSSEAPDVEYSEDDLQALRVFAENAGACIRHAEQAEWMRQTIENIRKETGRASQATPV